MSQANPAAATNTRPAHRTRDRVFSLVGTPDYIAPEVFSGKGYTNSVDWWSLGTIFFEMLIGFPPFYADTQQETCQKVINWPDHFEIPSDRKLSPEAEDLMRRLICGSSRLEAQQVKD